MRVQPPDAVAPFYDISNKNDIISNDSGACVEVLVGIYSKTQVLIILLESLTALLESIAPFSLINSVSVSEGGLAPLQ